MKSQPSSEAGATSACRARKNRFVEPLQQNCLTGKSPQKSVQPLCGKYSSCRPAQITGISPRIPSHSEGRIAIVTNAGWDAVDAAASARRFVRRAVFRERATARRRTALVAYGKTVWSRHPLLVPSCRWRRRSDRIDEAIKPAATVTRRIRRRGERGISRKAIAQGMSECFR